MLVQWLNLKKIGKVFTSKFVGTGPSSYEKRIYRAAVSQRLRNTAIASHYTDWAISVQKDSVEDAWRLNLQQQISPFRLN